MLVSEAFKILSSFGITSNIESLRRWIRLGELKAVKTSNRKEYIIDENDLNLFIEKKLKEKYKREKLYRKGFLDGFDAAKRLYNPGGN